MAAFNSRTVDLEPEAADLKGITRSILLYDTIRAASETASGWLVLVMDSTATRRLSSVASMFDIMEENITLVEALEKRRQPFPDLEVIYLITPTMQSINRLCADFAHASKPMYGDVHLYFLSKVSDAGMMALQSAPELLQRVKTFKEINVDFLAIESQVFHLDEPSTFRELYVGAPPPSDLVPIPERWAGKLFTLCASVHELPIIRCKTNAANPMMEQVGTILLEMLQHYAQQAGSTWWYHGQAGHTERPQSTLLLLDRSDDPLSPAMHFCTYQAIVYDMLPIEGEVVTYMKEDDKGKKFQTSALLNENDDLWMKFRHKHIAEVIGEISEMLTEFRAKKQDIGPQGNLSLEEMGAVVKSLPEYKAQLAKFSQHAQIAHECMNHLSADNNALLNTIYEIEQTLSTGFDDDNKAMRLSSVLDSMVDQFISDDRNYKLRLAIILIASQRTALTDAERERMFSAANFSAQDRALLDNLRHLLVTTPPAPPVAAAATSRPKSRFFGLGKSKATSSQAAAAASAAQEEGDYLDRRFVVPIKGIAEALVTDRLDSDQYPRIPGQSTSAPSRPVAQSVRRNNPAWKNTSRPAFTGPRTLIFVGGGVTHAEMQAVYAVSEAHQKEILLGASTVLTPADYITELESMS